MPLQQKARTIKLGLAEVILLALLVVSSACALTVGNLQSTAWRRSWLEAPVMIIGLSLRPGHDGRVRLSDIHVDYRYAVNGRWVTGGSQYWPVQAALYYALPASALARLAEQGFLRFDDLPPVIISVLRRKGVEGFESIPERLVHSAIAQGLYTIEDTPRNIVAAARDRDYDYVANEIDRRFPDAAPLESRTGRAGLGLLSLLGLSVVYDPDNPSLHALTSAGRMDAVVQGSVLMIVVLITTVYAAFGYRWLKELMPESAPTLSVRMG